MKKFALVVAIIAALTWVSVPAQGRGQSKKDATITVVMVTDTNGNKAPNYGDQIGFTVTNTDAVSPSVEFTCSQSKVVVYSGLWPLTNPLTLKSQTWTGGSAECVATAYAIQDNKKRVLGTLNVAVGA